MYRNSYIFFIAKRISSLKGVGSGRVMLRTTITTIAISVAVMVVAINVIVGFRDEITSKVAGFASHFTITSLKNRDGQPISSTPKYLDQLKKLQFIKEIHPFTTKEGVLKNKEEIKGVVLKGVDSSYNFSFLEKSLKEGRLPQFNSSKTSKEVIISKAISNEMFLKVGDKFEMMFITGNNIFRTRLEVVGIYQTSLSEFDATTIIGDIKETSRVSHYKDGEIGGFEITTSSLEKVDEYLPKIEDVVFEYTSDKENVMVRSIREEYIRIFDWLDLQDVNIIITMVVMIFVSAFSMIAMMLIILIEKSSMIGTLKTLGMNDKSLQKLFLIRISYIVAVGILAGMILALTFSYIQLYLKPLKLSSDAYFLEYVPIKINYIYLCGVAIYSFLTLLLLQALPVRIISTMSPHESIKYN